MKKKVLFVFHDSNPLSGATASMLDIVIRLKEKGHYEIIALIPNAKGGIHNKLNSQGIKYFEDNIYNVRHNASSDGVFVKKLKSFAKVALNLYLAIKLTIKKDKFDLVYTNTSDIYIGAFISKLLNVKHIWHIREFGIEDQNMTHIFGESSFYKMVNYTSIKVIVISNALKNKLIFCNVPENKIEMIYNDVTSSKDVCSKVYNSNDELSLLIVGTICEEKGHKFVVDCVAHMKSINLNVKLSIVGHDNTEYAIYLKNFIRQIGCEDRIDFVGYSSNVEDIRANYDIAVIASKSEAFGRVTVEAMHSKMAVVASDCGANPELIENNKNGFLFEYGDVDDFSKKISYIDHDRSLLKILGTQAFLDSSKFASGQAANKINEVICSILNLDYN